MSTELLDDFPIVNNKGNIHGDTNLHSRDLLRADVGVYPSLERRRHSLSVLDSARSPDEHTKFGW